MTLAKMMLPVVFGELDINLAADCADLLLVRDKIEDIPPSMLRLTLLPCRKALHWPPSPDSAVVAVAYNINAVKGEIA